MKFVLFNVAVVAALFLLFNPDRSDLRVLADRASAAVGGAVEKAIGGEYGPVKEDAGNTGSDRVMVERTEPVQTTGSRVVEKNVADAQDSKVEPKPEPDIKPVRAARQDRAEAVRQPQPTAEPALDPAVAKRRAEVLGLAPLPVTETSPIAGDELMSAEQRRRELFTLAEEMELFYVKRLSR